MELDVRGPTATAMSSAQRTVARGSRLGGKLCTDGFLVYSRRSQAQMNYCDSTDRNSGSNSQQPDSRGFEIDAQKRGGWVTLFLLFSS